MRSQFLLVSLTVLTATMARAEFASRTESKLGYTSNANLEATETDSDFFLALSTSNNYRLDKNTVGLRLGYNEFFKQDLNDVFNWRLSDRYVMSTKWSFYGALFGQRYPRGAPGTTDQSFDNNGFDLKADRAVEITGSSELIVGPGLQHRRYTEIGRGDTTVYATAEYDHELSQRTEINSRAEFGIVGSSVPEYSKYYLELALGGNFLARPDLLVTGEIGLRRSVFTNRTISSTTVTSRRRGQTITSTIEEKETYSAVDLSVSLLKTVNENLKAGTGLATTSNSSASGYYDYSVLELYGNLILSF